MNRLFDMAFPKLLFGESDSFEGPWAPALDVYDDKERIVVKAKFKNGVLELTMEKKEKAKPKQVDIDIQ